MPPASSPLNPYARQLGDRDPVTVLRATPARLSAALAAHAALPDRRPAPGRWSAREIVVHLADVEMVHAVRLRQALAQPHHVIQPFDQNAWAERYAAYEMPVALACFLAARRFALTLLDGLTAEDLARPVTHPERGTMALRVLVETFAGHDLAHLDQLDSTFAALSAAAAAGANAG